MDWLVWSLFFLIGLSEGATLMNWYFWVIEKCARCIIKVSLHWRRIEKNSSVIAVWLIPIGSSRDQFYCDVYRIIRIDGNVNVAGFFCLVKLLSTWTLWQRKISCFHKQVLILFWIKYWHCYSNSYHLILTHNMILMSKKYYNIGGTFNEYMSILKRTDWI